MHIYLSVLMIAICTQVSIGQTISREEIRFPSQFSGVFHIQSRINDGPVTKQIQRGTFDKDWVRMDIYLVIEGVGESLQQARLGSLAETLILTPNSYQVSRTDRFEQTRTDAGEINLTPMPIFRNLIPLSNIALRVVNPNGTETLEVPELKVASTGNAEIVLENDRIVEYREGPLDDDKWVVLIRYKNWTTLPSGNRIPTTIQTETQISVDRVLHGEATLVSYEETDLVSADRNIVVPDDFTIIDHIEGVTKYGNGEIIAPINYENINDPLAQNRSGALVTKDKLFIGLGVAMVIGAGVILRFRSKAAG